MNVTTSSRATLSRLVAKRAVAGLLLVGTLLGACGGAAQVAAPNPTPLDTIAATAAPTAVPTATPTAEPTVAATVAPTAAPTIAPTAAPTIARTAAPTAARTVAPTLAPTTAPTAAPTAPRPAFLIPDEPQAIGYLTKATGYGIVPIPATNASRLATNFSASPAFGSFLTGYSVRMLTKNGNTVALALVLSLCPCASTDPGFLDSFVNGMSEASGVVPLRETIAGQRAAYFDGGSGETNELVWVQGSELVVLYGMNRTAMEQLATALITANQ